MRWVKGPLVGDGSPYLHYYDLIDFLDGLSTRLEHMPDNESWTRRDKIVASSMVDQILQSLKEAKRGTGF